MHDIADKVVNDLRNESLENIMDCSDLEHAETGASCEVAPTEAASVMKPPEPTVLTPNHKKRVYVVGGGMVEAHMFVRHGFTTTTDFEKADIMVFTGGADVNPLLYGERALKGVQINPQRDTTEIRFWRNAPKNCFKVGICRGGQLLNVLNGGRLWQDVDNHGRSHTITDVLTQKIRTVSSTHHQQFIPAADAQVVAYTNLSSRKQNEMVNWKLPLSKPVSGTREYEYAMDYEVLWYSESRSLCFQPHPEYNHPADTENYFFEVLNRYF